MSHVCVATEHFVHQERKAHAKFATVSALRLNRFAAANQVCSSLVRSCYRCDSLHRPPRRRSATGKS